MICSYGFARSRHNALAKYKDAFHSLPSRIVSAASTSQYFRTHASHLRRPSAPLHSEVYKALGLPIRCFFMDEAHNLKNEDGETHLAVKAIPAQFRFALTGTIFPSRWSDVFALASFLSGHPFGTRNAFQKAFAQQVGTSTITEPSGSKRRRLDRFLQACVVARPVTVLELPHLTQHTGDFFIANDRTIAQIMYLVQQFYLSSPKGGMTIVGLTTDTGDSNIWADEALYCMHVAQVIANNPELPREKDKTYLDLVTTKAVTFADRLFNNFRRRSTLKYAVRQDFTVPSSTTWINNTPPAIETARTQSPHLAEPLHRIQICTISYLRSMDLA